MWQERFAWEKTNVNPRALACFESSPKFTSSCILFLYQKQVSSLCRQVNLASFCLREHLLRMHWMSVKLKWGWGPNTKSLQGIWSSTTLQLEGLNSLSSSPTKWSNTLKQFVGKNDSYAYEKIRPFPYINTLPIYVFLIECIPLFLILTFTNELTWC